MANSGTMYQDLVDILGPDIQASLEPGGDDPLAHGMGSSLHVAGTLAQLNTKVSDATLDASTASRTPLAHKASHEVGGSDEISVLNLSGLLADGQTPLSHAASHEVGGTDEISVLNLSGLLADGQTPLSHAASHESGGSDELSIAQAQVAGTLLVIAQDAACAILNTTAGIYLVDSTAATKTITVTSTYAGQIIPIRLALASGGEYVLPVTGGTLTFNATDEEAMIMRNAADDAWYVLSLVGATIV